MLLRTKECETHHQNSLAWCDLLAKKIDQIYPKISQEFLNVSQVKIKQQSKVGIYLSNTTY